jgi:hypothetical protein
MGYLIVGDEVKSENAASKMVSKNIHGHSRDAVAARLRRKFRDRRDYYMSCPGAWAIIVKADD